jgi:sialate O-acetylesterase
MARVFGTAAVLALSAAAAPHHAAAIHFSATLGDHAVLQRGVAATVWGFDTPLSTVTSTLFMPGGAAVTLRNVTGLDGVWRQQLPPQPASLASYNITATSSATGSASLSDVLFGDVIVCGGQSNMQFSLSAALNATAEIAAANYPYIRLFTVGQGTSSNTPLVDLNTTEQPWTATTPATVSQGDFGVFSAICYLTGRDLFNALGGEVPLGLISNNWGGTCLQSWVPASVTDVCGDPPPVGPINILYNSMINPYAVGPMAVSAFLWSQGECNADANQTDFYACAFKPMIQAWRASFSVARPDAFFGFEVLPAYISDASFSPASLPYEREAQLTALALPGVAAANAIDLGDALAPHGSVHPRNKTAVARRLAAAALAQLCVILLFHSYAISGATTNGGWLLKSLPWYLPGTWYYFCECQVRPSVAVPQPTLPVCCRRDARHNGVGDCLFRPCHCGRRRLAHRAQLLPGRAARAAGRVCVV